MKVLSLEEIERRLSDRTHAEVARRTGLHANTVRKYAKGEVKDPAHATVVTLSEYLTEGEEVES